MLESQISVNTFMMAYLHRLIEDLPEDALDREPAPGLNTPLWILGHLAVMPDYALRVLSKPMLCPASWHKAFARGSLPADVPAPHPTKAELIAALDCGYAALVEAVREADAQTLAAPNPLPPFKDGPIKTVADLLTLVLTAHLGAHLGHLSSGRRLRGLPPLF